ncbi:hypothetical protein MPY17_33875 [Rhodococcus opacus]|uniref:hypothetical protein n=1 Tax=Rhodococcus opacus TaxID=37919 RepID=UPI001FF3A510|nr:hypothetical protein [Rhodococcus opacus]UOT03832.1 hypothetical protein MPY17_33875 [Rhodococcus opacus]
MNNAQITDTSIPAAVGLYGRLDVAFNNAATSMPPAPMDQVPEPDFDHAMP